MNRERKVVLVVDDELDTLELIQTILKHEGFEVWKTANGKEALELVEKKPDLILLDVRMPGGLSGIDVCRKLKNDEKFKHIPIIIFSAKILDNDIRMGLEAGAEEYITKPFSSKDLLEIINRYIL